MATRTQAEFTRLNAILEQVGQLDGISGLRLSAEGTARLRYKGGKEVFFEYCRKAALLFIYTPLFPLPSNPTRKEELMHVMLSSNFLKLETWCGELAIDAKSDEAIYQIGMDIASLNVDLLDRQIGNLLRQSEELRFTLQSRKAPTDDAPRLPESTSSRIQRLLYLNR